MKMFEMASDDKLPTEIAALANPCRLFVDLIDFVGQFKLGHRDQDLLFELGHLLGGINAMP